MSRRFLSLQLLAAALAVTGCSPTTTRTPAPRTIDGARPPADPDDAPLPLWPEVRRGTLPNGLTYYVMKHSKPEKRELLWLAVNAGSAQEDDDQRGLAHFDEHMAFNGTRRFPKNDIIDYLEKIGMRFGADLNAYTSWDQTVYQLQVPTDDPKFVAKGLDILRDWAGDVTYDGKEVAKERGVVKEEWRLGRGAQMRMFDKHAHALFAGTRYADRITIGLPEIIDKAPPEALTRFYKDWYRPDLMAVIAVGDFDPAQIEKEIRARFGELPASPKPRMRPDGGVPPSKGTRVSIETDKELTNTSVTVSNLLPHRPMRSRNDYRRVLGEQLYATILNERLASIARQPDAPFMIAAGGVSTPVREIDSFDRFAAVKGGRVEDTLRAMLTEVARIERHGITATEVERARTNMVREISQIADAEATEDSRLLTEEITRNFFAQEEMIGGAAEKAMTLQLLPLITVDDLNARVKAFGGGDNRAILISSPPGKPMPNREQVLAIVEQVAHADLKPWQDRPHAKALMATLPTPGKVIKESKNDKVGVTDWTLSNGVRVIIKPTDFEVDAVTLMGESPGGEAMASDADFASARFASDAAQVGGVGDFDADALAKVLAGKHVRVSSSIGDVIESVSGSGSVRDLETMLQLVHLRMTAPRRDPVAFGVWQQNFMEQLANMQRSPEMRFAIESNKLLWQNHLRMRMPTPEDIQAVDLDKALAFYRDRFGDASDFTFVIVGAVQLEALKPLVETYLGSLPGKGRKERERDLPGLRKRAGVLKNTWKFGQEPKAAVRLEFHADEPWTREKDRDLFILGEVLSIKLREVMREDLGGVYGVGANGHFARSPRGERSFGVRFGCAPERVDELVRSAFAEVAKLVKNGVAPEILDKVKATYVRTRETDLRKNTFWAGWLSSAYRFGDDPAIILDTAPLVARMTSGNVQASARHYLDAKQFFQAVLVPEASAPAPVKAP